MSKADEKDLFSVSTLGSRSKKIQQTPQVLHGPEIDQGSSGGPRICTSKQSLSRCGPLIHPYLGSSLILETGLTRCSNCMKSLPRRQDLAGTFPSPNNRFLGEFQFGGWGPMFQQSDDLIEKGKYLFRIPPVLPY